MLQGAQEREAALLAELDLAKRAQVEAEQALARVQVALKQEQAQVLAAAQAAQHAAAEQARRPSSALSSTGASALPSLPTATHHPCAWLRRRSRSRCGSRWRKPRRR